MEHADRDDALERKLRAAKPAEMATPDFAAWVNGHAEAVEDMQKGGAAKDSARLGWPGPVGRVAALVGVLVALGFVLGRFSVGPTPNGDALRVALEASLREEVIEPMGVQWQATLQASHDRLRRELLQQVHHDLGDIATQTLAASRAITDQRMTELIRLIEAARERDRQRVALALHQIEVNRKQDRIDLGSGLQYLAAHTIESLDGQTE